MNFTCTTEDLKSALMRVMPAVATKPMTPILSGIRIKAIDGKALLHAVNQTFAIQSRCEADVAEEGEIIVNGVRFEELVKGSDGETITLATDKGFSALKVRSGKASFKLIIMKEQEFPELYSEDARDWDIRFALPFGKLMEMVSQTGYAVGRPSGDKEVRPFFLGIVCNVKKDKLTFIGTNSRRIALRSLPIDSNEEKDGLIIPVNVMLAVAKKMKEKEDTEVQVSFRNGNTVLIQAENWSVLSSLLAGKCPDVFRVIPPLGPIEFEVEKDALAGAITRMALCGEVDEGYSVIAIKTEYGGIRIHATSREVGVGEEFVPCKVKGGPLNVAFNAAYWMDGLAHMPSDVIRVTMTTPTSPVVVYPEGEDEYLYVMAPVRQIA